MISILVCSNNTGNPIFKQNIKETIGVPFELLIYDNRDNEGICFVYNKLKEMANFEYLLFIHEDVHFLTKNWGLCLNEILKNQEVGLVFMGGAIYKSSIPTSWVHVAKEYYRGGITQDKSIKNLKFKNCATNKDSYSEIVVGDGCFIAGRRQIFNKFPWNDNEFKGFHLYDLDLSIRVGSHFKLVTPNNIKMLHFSSGNFDLKWIKDSIRFHKIYKKKLPLVKLMGKKDVNEMNYFSIISLISLMNKLEYNFAQRIYYCLYALILKPHKRLSWGMFKKQLVK
jgi:hypothetical protein